MLDVLRYDSIPFCVILEVIILKQWCEIYYINNPHNLFNLFYSYFVGGEADAEDTEDQQQWEDDWDTEAVDDDFSKQLRYFAFQNIVPLWDGGEEEGRSEWGWNERREERGKGERIRYYGGVFEINLFFHFRLELAKPQPMATS